MRFDPFDVNGRPVLVGPRFNRNDVNIDTDSVIVECDGANTISARTVPAAVPRPIAGPVVKELTGVPGEKPRHFGHCLNCGDTSHAYLRASNPGLWKWARDHRCRL